MAEDPSAASADSGAGRRRIDPHLLDALLALLFTSGALVMLLARGTPAPPLHADDALGTVLILLTTVPLALFHFQPLAAYTVMLGATMATAGLGYQTPLATSGALLVGLFMITLITSFRSAIVAGVMTGIASLVASIFLQHGPVNVGATILSWLAFSATWLLGIVIKVYRESAARASRRAALFAQDRELRAQEAVAQERARLARELHDGVGHALNVVVLHAQGALRVLDNKPHMARESLAAIETSGRQALVDVERMLGVLRSEEDYELAARPGLGRLDVLARQVSDAGLPVGVRREGDAVELPTTLDLTAYRIVQEALTNSLKHAGHARAAVTVRYLADSVELEVTDTGRGAASPAAVPPAAGGRGIPGMRERVAVFGGSLEIGPRAEGGFRVWARLPLAART